MAIRKVRIRPKGNGDYSDIVHPQTSADMVLLADTAGKFSSNDLEGALAELVEIKTATITTDWVGTEAPYTQEVAVDGITADNNPIICPVYSEINETAVLQKAAWSLIGKAVTGAGKIIFTCFEEKPTTAIPIQIKGV